MKYDLDMYFTGFVRHIFIKQEISSITKMLGNMGDPQLTFKKEGFVPVRVEIFPLDFGLEFVLSVGQQVDFDEGVGGPREVFSGQVLTFEYLHRQSRVLEAVAQAELNPAQFLAHWTFVVVVFRPRRQLKRAWERKMNVKIGAVTKNTKAHTLQPNQRSAIKQSGVF